MTANEPDKQPETPGATSRLLRGLPKSPKEALKPVAVAPPPPARPRNRRHRPLIGLISGLLTALLVILAGAGVLGLMAHRNAADPGPLQSDKVVIIPRDTGVAETAEILAREGVIAQALPFRLSAMIGGDWQRMKAGEYLFRANISQRDVLNQIVRGDVVRHSITIPEGLTSQQVVQRLMDNDLLTGTVTNVPREGTLMPDTIRFERGQTRQELIDRMQREHRRILREVWAKRSPELPIKTEQELVILASIVEKETGRADERPRVASVFVNRLNRKMKLQSDPTIVYGLVGGKGTLGRGILRTEITQATPYNTYVIDGLPPGPICNPGRASLEAVVNPSRTKDLFFVADGTGGHAFAETLDQHNRNVARWRQVERSRQDPSRPPAEASVDRVEPPPAPDNRTEAPASALPERANALAPPPAAPQPADVETYPVPASRRAAMGQPAPAAPQAPAGQTGGIRRSLDASEGTKLDPLLNRSFDLNSPKTVPSLR